MRHGNKLHSLIRICDIQLSDIKKNSSYFPIFITFNRSIPSNRVCSESRESSRACAHILLALSLETTLQHDRLRSQHGSVEAVQRRVEASLRNVEAA